jgi:hypothetical protein
MSARTITSFNVTTVSSTITQLSWNSTTAQFGFTTPINWWILKSTDLSTSIETTFNITLYNASGIAQAGGNATFNGNQVINNTGILTGFSVFDASNTTNYLNLVQGHNATFSIKGRGFIVMTSTEQFTNNMTTSLYTVPQLPSVPCFLEGSLILCADGVYRPIETLSKGVMVKTFEHGDVAIDVVGKSVLHHKKDNDKRDRLFVYKTDAEDLVLTGGHSVLVDQLTVPQVKDILSTMGNIFMTDTKFRLPSCLDDRAEPYERYDESFSIYHICLSNQNPELNYGVYSNGGMLVETCQKECIEKMDETK